MPHDIVLKTANVIHRGLTKISFGHLGWTMGSMPVLELTTTGRKSGQPRTVMLTSPVKQGENPVIVASKGGEDHHPAWFLNLRDNPHVQVSIGGAPKRDMVARVASVAERLELWPQVTAGYKGYAGYQTKTTREIPLVILEPDTR